MKNQVKKDDRERDRVSTVEWTLRLHRIQRRFEQNESHRQLSATDDDARGGQVAFWQHRRSRIVQTDS